MSDPPEDPAAYSTGPDQLWWQFWKWIDYRRDVQYLVIDYDGDAREREEQILKIVDDNGFKFKIFFVAASGFLASSYSLFSTNVIMPSLYYVYPPCGRLSGKAGEIIDLLTLIGAVVGMLSMGHLADRAGRKKLYGQELAILLIGTIGVVQASEGYMVQKSTGSYDHSMDIYAWIPWWRFALGFGIGAEYPLSAVIASEWSSTESRGTMLAAVFAMQTLGRLIAFATTLGAIQDFNVASNTQLAVDRAWRLIIGVGMIPAAAAILLRFTIPETPRYDVDIRKDLRKAVKRAFQVYSKTRKERVNPESRSAGSGPTQESSDDENDHWFRGAWSYLRGPEKAGRRLLIISALWALLDVAWYGLSLDSPSTLSTLAYNPATNSSSFNFKRSQPSSCSDTTLWDTDFWENNETIDHMLHKDSLRSILIVSVAGVVGSISSILLINHFHRRSLLIATFSLLSVHLAVFGGTLIVLSDAHKSHLVTDVFYAILQFFFNLGPNTLIFVIAAEIFPTVYRGTFYGIAAACGKIGAICIRAIIGATGNQEKSLGIRLLVFIPFMVLAAALSWFLPEVQVEDVSRRSDAEAATVGQSLWRLKNKTLEEISPNPRRKNVNEAATHGQNGIRRVNENHAASAQVHTAQTSVGETSTAQVAGLQASWTQASGPQASEALGFETPGPSTS